MIAQRVEYDIRIKITKPLTHDHAGQYARLKTSLIRWIADHADEGEIVLMSSHAAESEVAR